VLLVGSLVKDVLEECGGGAKLSRPLIFPLTKIFPHGFGNVGKRVEPIDGTTTTFSSISY
jgi:hypothetical protein